VTAREQLRGHGINIRHEEKVLKARKKSSDSARCVPLRSSAGARTWLLPKKRYNHTIIFLEAGNKLALLVKV